MTLMSELPVGDTHDVIRHGGQVVAVIVPIDEYRQLRQVLQEQQVNEEFDELDNLLGTVPEILQSGGRFVVLTFMSSEDRKVKQAFQAIARAGQGRILTKHVIRPTQAEVSSNAASRGAKLRAIERS